MDVPPSVAAATANAAAMGATTSCAPRTGALLSTLACAVPPGGRILELGTGAGVGLSWILEGVRGRTDVEVVSVESDPAAAAIAAWLDWPSWVRLEVGDGIALVEEPGQWDLVFADARDRGRGALDRTVRSLRAGGLLLVDGVSPDGFGRHLLADEAVIPVAITGAGGLVLCARRHDGFGAG